MSWWKSLSSAGSAARRCAVSRLKHQLAAGKWLGLRKFSKVLKELGSRMRHEQGLFNLNSYSANLSSGTCVNEVFLSNVADGARLTCPHFKPVSVGIENTDRSCRADLSLCLGGVTGLISQRDRASGYVTSQVLRRTFASTNVATMRNRGLPRLLVNQIRRGLAGFVTVLVIRRRFVDRHGALGLFLRTRRFERSLPANQGIRRRHRACLAQQKVTDHNYDQPGGGDRDDTGGKWFGQPIR